MEELNIITALNSRAKAVKRTSRCWYVTQRATEWAIQTIKTLIDPAPELERATQNWTHNQDSYTPSQRRAIIQTYQEALRLLRGGVK